MLALRLLDVATFDRRTDVVDDSRLVPGDAAMPVWPMRRAPVMPQRGRGKTITTMIFTDFQQTRLDDPFSANGRRQCQKGLSELGSAGLNCRRSLSLMSSERAAGSGA